MIHLNERDADRIAAYLRNGLKATKGTFERFKILQEEYKELAAAEDRPAEDNENSAERWNRGLAALSARAKEIEELLVLLMAGSEEK